MRASSLWPVAALLLVTACAGHEKGSAVGLGFDTLDTQSKESKENEKWFDSFYGSKHCHGQWAGECSPSDSGGGGLWGSTATQGE